MEFEIVEKWKILDKRYKAIIICSFAIGLLSQGMGIFNKYSVLDDVTNYGAGMTYEIGRWMLDILAKLEVVIFGDDNYSLSTYNGFIALLLIAISACFIVATLEIKNLFLCIFISGIMVSFPVITSIFGFMFTLHFYMLSLLLGCAGTFLVCCKENIYFRLAGICLITMSIGVYQAFLPVVTSVMCIYLINICVRNSEANYIIKKLLVVGCSLFIALGLYFGINRLYLNIMNAELATYKGISNVTQIPISVYCIRVLSAYKEIFIPKTDMGYFMFPGTLLFAYRLVLLLSVIFSVLLVYKKLKHNRVVALITTCIILLLPLSINLIAVMVDRNDIHSLMVYAHLFVFIYFAWLLDNIVINSSCTRLCKLLTNVTTILMILIILMFCRLDNKCYLKATYAQSDAISYATTLITQIKSVEGYKTDMPVVFIYSEYSNDTTLQAGDLGHMEDINYLPYYDVRGYVTSYSFREFMRQWCGFSSDRADEAYFAGLEEVQQMPHYPEDGSIKVVEKTVVIKY